MKNMEVKGQIEQMLQQISSVDDQQYNIILRLLSDVFKEFNSGTKHKVDQKLWDHIDAEIKLSHSKQQGEQQQR